MALQAGSTGTYDDRLAAQAPAVQRPRRSAPMRREARLAYAILSPTLLVILPIRAASHEAATPRVRQIAAGADRCRAHLAGAPDPAGLGGPPYSRIVLVGRTS